MAEREKILQSHGLRNTAFRIALLEMFLQSKSSLSVEEIKNKAGETKDKVTIYRALDAFEKCGLIHEVPDKGNHARYALCNTACDSEGHVHNHAHLICNNCNDTFCIDQIEVPRINSAAGFKINSSQLTLEGICPDCITN
jgi:Fur family ferric uptake transcriptional regulator